MLHSEFKISAGIEQFYTNIGNCNLFLTVLEKENS
jgi:hypothetical protein